MTLKEFIKILKTRQGKHEIEWIGISPGPIEKDGFSRSTDITIRFPAIGMFESEIHRGVIPDVRKKDKIVYVNTP